MKYFSLAFLLIYFCNLTVYDQAYCLKCVKAATGRSRFGDCLSIVYAANYISDKYKMPVIYQDFVESNNLEIQDQINDTKYKFKSFKVIKLTDESQINLKDTQDVIYEVRIDFFTKKYYEITKIEELRKKFKELIKPKNKISMPCSIKEGVVTIAAHVRKGGGFDLPLLSKDGLFDDGKKSNFKPVDACKLSQEYQKKIFRYSDLRWPHKFPPDSFFVEQIKYIATLFPGKHLHVHIFTDDKDPILLKNKYEKALNNKNITLSCRETDNAHNKNITDDFFAMTQFDCLIRPASTYSQNIEMLGDFKVIIWPEHSTWIEKDRLVIDQVNIIKI